jgi:hypothetical protein
MEREYAAACRRLSGDWRAVERGWTHRRRALRARQRDLRARDLRLRALAHAHTAHVSPYLYSDAFCCLLVQQHARLPLSSTVIYE